MSDDEGGAQPVENVPVDAGLGPQLEVGVGPWPGGPEAWPDGEHFDPELLAEGDRRNVVDHYRYWRTEAIRADLDRSRHTMHVAIENLRHDMNIGSVVRTANAFNLAAVHVVGRRRWNRRGAMVTDRYMHLRHHADVGELAAWAGEQGLPIIGIDNLPGSMPIEGRSLPRDVVLLFGQESAGLSAPAQEMCQEILHITQYGSSRSINAGAAAAVAMHCWMQQHGRADGPAS